MEERLYDLIFICRPDTPEADIDKVIATLEHTATEKGAQDREDREVGPQAHGLPRAAPARGLLRVHGHSFEPRRSGEGTRAPAEGFRRVIKYLTVRVDEELKRQEKLKRHRERRAARRPRKTVAAGSAPPGGTEQAARGATA